MSYFAVSNSKNASMKRLKILCTLLLVSFLIATTQNFLTSFVNGFNLGWNIGEYEELQQVTSQTHMSLNLIPRTDSLQLNAENVKDSSAMIIVPEKVTCITFVPNGQQNSTSEIIYTVVDVLLNIGILVCVVILLVQLVKIILSFRRSEVFEEKNILRIKFIGRMFIVVALLSTLWEFLRVWWAKSLLELAQYNISYMDIIDWEDIIIGLVILLMNEILIIATGIKKEQDLTI
jgi:ABC-type sugar transport system permease subunit